MFPFEIWCPLKVAAEKEATGGDYICANPSAGALRIPSQSTRMGLLCNTIDEFHVPYRTTIEHLTPTQRSKYARRHSCNCSITYSTSYHKIHRVSSGSISKKGIRKVQDRECDKRFRSKGFNSLMHTRLHILPSLSVADGVPPSDVQ